MSSPQQCSNCLYFRNHSTPRCYRRAPYLGKLDNAAFPIIMADGWCGEWKKVELLDFHADENPLTKSPNYEFTPEALKAFDQNLWEWMIAKHKELSGAGNFPVMSPEESEITGAIEAIIKAYQSNPKATPEEIKKIVDEEASILRAIRTTQIYGANGLASVVHWGDEVSHVSGGGVIKD